MEGSFQNKVKQVPFSKLVCAGARIAHPSLLLVLGRDYFGWQRPPRDSSHHMDATMKWLFRAQDVTGCGGVSAGYSLREGWLPPYPETTGYIIPTFFDYANLTHQEEAYTRAVRMADWEIHVQLPGGAIQAGLYRGNGGDRGPAVFNTGQVIFGWCRSFAETKDDRYLAAATRAGDWLVSVQDPDGAWRQREQETETVAHAYNVRTAWSLLELYKLAPDERYKKAACLNLEWTLDQQQENGWFNHNAFFLSDAKWNVPFTHTIAYVLEGLLGAWLSLKEPRYLQAVQKTAERLMRIFELRRFLAGEFDSAWKSTATYTCLTGDAQIAGVWLRLYEVTCDTRFLNAALKLNDMVKATHSLHSVHGGVRGGVKGSQPIFGRYTPFIFVNWGAKFLADSLMLEERLMKSFEQAVCRGDNLGPGGIAETKKDECLDC